MKFVSNREERICRREYINQSQDCIVEGKPSMVMASATSLGKDAVYGIRILNRMTLQERAMLRQSSAQNHSNQRRS